MGIVTKKIVKPGKKTASYTSPPPLGKNAVSSGAEQGKWLAQEMEAASEEVKKATPKPAKATEMKPVMTALAEYPNKTKTEEHIELDPVVKDASKLYGTVGFEAGRTITDGNYGSYRFSVSLSVPTELTADEVDANFQACQDFVDDKLTSMIEAVQKGGS